MGYPIASRTRLQIRQAVGYNLGSIIVSTSSANGSVTTLTDAVELAKGIDNEHKNWHLQSNAGLSTGLKRWVITSTATAGTLVFVTMGGTIVPLSTEAYELWKPPVSIDTVNSKITEAENEVAGRFFTDKEAHDIFTEKDRYQYDIPTGFVAVSSVEHVTSVGEEETIDTCDGAWSEQGTVSGVTQTNDTTINKEGSGCLKLVVADAVAGGTILASKVISSLDLTDCTEVEIWIRSSVALTAGYVQLLLSATALCASPLETLSIPATTANTWTRHVITLANPESDGAIISVGLKMATDVGAFTLYADYILAVNANTRVFDFLRSEYWDIVKGSTSYLKLTSKGLAVIGWNKMLRLQGYQKFTAMSADTSTSQVDPDFLINRVTGEMMVAYGLRSDSDPKASLQKAQHYLAIAEKLKHRISTSVRAGTKFL